MATSSVRFTGELKEGIASITKTYWSSDKAGENEITQANLENTVYFHIKTVGLANQTLTLQLFDEDTIDDDDKFDGKKIEKKCQLDKNGYGKIELVLPLSWTDDLEGEKWRLWLIDINITYRKLYWKVISGHENVNNKKIKKFLQVHRSDRFLHVESSEVYNLPQVYTTEGEQITVFAEYIKEKIKDKAKEEVIDFVTTAIEESVKDNARKYAVAKLSKGYLVTQSREIIGGPKNAKGRDRQIKSIVYDIEGGPPLLFRANDVDYKNFKGERISTKGVDPYKVFYDQKAECKLKVLGYFNKAQKIYDIFQVLKQAMECKPGESLPIPTLATGPAMFFELVGMMAYYEFSKLDDALEEYRRKQLEEAKGEGLAAVEALLSNWKYWNGVAKARGAELSDDDIVYDTLYITAETAMKIKQGEFKTYEELESFIFQAEEDKNITVLYRNQYDSIRKGRVYVIETFFMNMEEEYEY